MALFSCDNNESDCKINFDLQIENSWSFVEIDEKKYTCLWDFWLWNLLWEENKCNPLTITIPKGIFNINYKISNKNNLSNFDSKSIISECDAIKKNYDMLYSIDKSYINNLKDSERILTEINDILKNKFNILHATIQVEPNDFHENSCPLNHND